LVYIGRSYSQNASFWFVLKTQCIHSETVNLGGVFVTDRCSAEGRNAKNFYALEPRLVPETVNAFCFIASTILQREPHHSVLLRGLRRRYTAVVFLLVTAD